MTPNHWNWEKGKRTLNPPPKEPPKHNGIPHQANPIPQHHLRPQPPPEEPKITRMPQPAVNPFRHKHMPLLPTRLHHMIEIPACLRHRHRPHHLPCNKQCEPRDQPADAQSTTPRFLLLLLPCNNNNRRCCPGERVTGGKRRLVDEALEEGEEVGDVVRAAIVQEEGGRGRAFRVVQGCGVVFQAVEEGEGGEEEAQAPQWVGVADEVHGRQCGLAQDETEEVGAKGERGRRASWVFRCVGDVAGGGVEAIGGAVAVRCSDMTVGVGGTRPPEMIVG